MNNKIISCKQVAVRMLSICLTLLLLGFSSNSRALDNTISQIMKVTVRHLNIRSIPGTESPPVAVLEKGTLVDLIGENGKWSQVRWYDESGYRTGYAWSNYLVCYGDMVYYALETVNVRSEPNTSSNILGSLEAGEPVVYLNRTGKWIKVQYEGKTGYVYGKYLDKNRINSFYSHPVATIIGKRNIKSISYSYQPNAYLIFGSEITPVMEICYTVRMQRKDNEFKITVYRFDAEFTAKLARDAIADMTRSPGNNALYYQSGDTVVIYNLYIDMKDTETEKQLYSKILAEIQSKYGEQIRLHGD